MISTEHKDYIKLLTNYTEKNIFEKLQEAYNLLGLDNQIFFDGSNWFLSLTKNKSRDIFLKYHLGEEPSNEELTNYLYELKKLQKENSSLQNLFLFTREEVNFIIQKKYSLLGIKFCSLDYLKDLFGKAENNIPHIELLAHNYIALKEINEYSKIKNKIGVVRATGTGKSFIIASLIAQHKGKKILLLSPSNLILTQLKKYFGESFFDLFDSMTYNKLSKKSSKDTLSIKYDFICLDEYHRGGASVWEDFVQKLILNNQQALIIGFTATDKRHLDNNRNMTEELFDGNSCAELSLTDAITHGILKKPYYVAALYNIDDNINKLSNQINTCTSSYKKQDLLDKLDEFKINWNKLYSMPNIFKKHLDASRNYKFIAFCKDTEHSKEMAILFKEWFLSAGFKNVITNEVNYTTQDNDVVISKFENDILSDGTISILLTVSLFNEGVRCANCNGVIFTRATQSNIIYSQQLGRALSSSNSQQPIIFDLMNNFKNIEKLNIFKKNKNYFKTNKVLDFIGFEENPNYIFDMHDEVIDSLSIFKNIEKNVTYDWFNWFDEYKTYINLTNSNIVPKSSSEYKSLYRWIISTRTSYRKGLLTNEQISLLNSINFSFDILEEQWFDSFSRWIKFKETYNREPSASSDNKEEVSIAKWCFQQRRLKKNNTIKEHRKEKLDQLGFKWSLRNQDWETNVNLMKKQIQIRGTSAMTADDAKDNPLYYWHKRIVDDYKNGTLSIAKQKVLEAIGFSFNEIIEKRATNDFEMRINQYLMYVKEFSRNNVRDADVKANQNKYEGLYNWYKAVRRKDNKKKKLTTEQIAILKNIGLLN